MKLKRSKISFSKIASVVLALQSVSFGLIAILLPKKSRGTKRAFGIMSVLGFIASFILIYRIYNSKEKSNGEFILDKIFGLDDDSSFDEQFRDETEIPEDESASEKEFE